MPAPVERSLRALVPILLLSIVAASAGALPGTRVALGASAQDAGSLHRYEGGADTICSFSLAQMLDRRLADGGTLIEVALSAGTSGAGVGPGCAAMTFGFAPDDDVWGAALATPGVWASSTRARTDLCGGHETLAMRAEGVADAPVFGLALAYDLEDWCDGSFTRVRVATQVAP